MRFISSRMTVVFKFVLPLLWATGFTISVISMFASDPSREWQPPGFFLVSAPLLYWFCLPLKCVAIDGNDLLISNYFRTIRVPLLNIRKVSECRLINPRAVWVHFHDATEFGSKIVFLSTFEILAIAHCHPIVDELRSYTPLGSSDV